MGYAPSLSGSPQTLTQSLMGNAQLQSQNLANQGQQLSNQTAQTNLQTLAQMNQQKVAFNDMVNKMYVPNIQSEITKNYASASLMGNQGTEALARAGLMGTETAANKINNKTLGAMNQADLALKNFQTNYGLPAAAMAKLRSMATAFDSRSGAPIINGQPIQVPIGGFGAGNGPGGMPGLGGSPIPQQAPQLPLSGGQQSNLQNTFGNQQMALNPQQVQQLAQNMGGQGQGGQQAGVPPEAQAPDESMQPMAQGVQIPTKEAQNTAQVANEKIAGLDDSMKSLNKQADKYFVKGGLLGRFFNEAKGFIKSIYDENAGSEVKSAHKAVGTTIENIADGIVSANIGRNVPATTRMVEHLTPETGESKKDWLARVQDTVDAAKAHNQKAMEKAGIGFIFNYSPQGQTTNSQVTIPNSWKSEADFNSWKAGATPEQLEAARKKFGG